MVISLESKYTPENRLKMYREVAEEKERKELSKKEQSNSLFADSMPDPFREAQKRVPQHYTDSPSS